MTTGFDMSVFREAPSPAETSSLQRLRGLGFGSKSTGITIIAVCLVVWLVCSMGIADAAVDSFRLDASALNIGSGIFLAGVISAAIGFILQARAEDPAVAALRLRNFAHHNGLSYQEEPKLPKLNGLIFEQGHHPQTSERFRNGPGHSFPFEIAHYSYRTGPERLGADERPSTTSWTYIAISVDRTLPRLVLDARKNNYWFVSNIPASLAKSQQVPLTGGYGKDFVLYAPEGYEQQARQIFPDTVLGMLLHHAPGFDVETADDQIIFFIRKELDLAREETWQQISTIVLGVGASMVALAAHQPADRIGANATLEVTPAGRTLRRRRFTPALLWTLAGGALLVVVRLLLTGPFQGLL